MRHPIFDNDFAPAAAALAASLAEKTFRTTIAVAEAAKRVSGITLPADRDLILPAHDAIMAVGERSLPNIPHTAASRDLVTLLAALHLELCGPLPIGNWGGFTTPELVGCPTCVRLHQTTFVNTPVSIAYATCQGMIDPRWTGDENNARRWVRLMWHYRTERVLETAVESLTPNGFWIGLDTEYRVLSAVRELSGAIGRARRFGESQFKDLDMVWYGAEVHFSPLIPATALPKAG